MALASGGPVVAIIPARGGSKRIPKKNLMPLHGKPLVAYSIQSATTCPRVNRVIVSTDDTEIERVSRNAGAEVMIRPASISDDTALSESALIHVLDTIRERGEEEPSLVVFLQATSPVRSPHDIQRCIEVIEDEGADSLFSACHVEGFVWKERDGNVSPVNYFPENRPRSQDLKEHILEENGSIYVFKPWVLRELGSRLGGQIAVYKMNRMHSFQVDVPEDVPIMEKMLLMTKPQE